MGPHVAYDITRLITRVLNETPNGIDRVDLAYALYFLSRDQSASALIHLGPLGHRSFAQSNGLAAVEGILDHFGERASANSPSRLPAIVAWLEGEATKPTSEKRKPKPSVLRVAQYYFKHLGILGQSPSGILPKNSVYLCVSQYPLSVIGAFDGLQQRKDIRPVFFIHDLLPFQFPEYFKVSERDRHERRMANLAKHAAAALVSTQVVGDDLTSEMKRRGRGSFPVHVSPMPMAQGIRPPTKPVAVNSNYFVMCGTIEPRKNHITILHAWRDLARNMGPGTPKLVLVGARGWENENVLDLLDRSPAIREYVLEVNGLSTPDLSALMSGATALLMPTFGEGYGLPLAEARQLGVPIIASDIPVFHEIAPGGFEPIHPNDGLGWHRAIIAAASSSRHRATPTVPSDQTDFSELDRFLASLSQ
jgi:glycosyltransferase involved in cell wall biosynthesis